ncbi:response regulator transcription factor [Frankia sp. Mgl5]|uniref:response regulator n=1 Tax=Frankia sp. Mgl5 TaxID=2933793 RepID=UPI00200E2556|nr:response regulator transcription factor [Frankia sp. Mgl5]MCK9932607.1 response regulator transcription factor [Frankia sp. Mgl5]
MKTSILLADDQALLRETFRLLIDTCDDLMVVAEAADGAAAVELARAHRPDIVVMDIQMPGVDGLAATAAICGDRELDATRVLILTMFETDEFVAQALRVGASGFVGKDIGAGELLAAIRTVARGDALLSAGATRALITRFLATAEPAAHLVPPGRLARLTPREREIMTLAAEGRSNEEIAQVLAIRPLTVRTHVHHAMAKLGARDRAQLVVIAYQSGLLRPARSSSDRTPVIPPPAPSAAP